jgi:tellurite resistance protein TerB
MSFWNKVKDAANSASKGLSDGWTRHVKSPDLLPAIASSMGLMVAADGKIEASEIEGVMDFVNNDATLAAWAADARTKAFEEALEAASKGIMRQASLFGKIAKLKGKPEAETMVQVVFALAHADGNFDDKEKVMFDRICNAVGLDSKKYS